MTSMTNSTMESRNEARASSLATRLPNKEKRFVGATPCLSLFNVLFVFICMSIIIARDSYNLFVKMLYVVFNFVLITCKGTVQELSLREI